MARARQIRAGRAYVELGVEDRLTRGLRRAQRQIQDFGRQVHRIGARLAGLGAAITAPLIAATRQFARTGDALDKMARRTGFSAEALSELGFAAEQSGADVETLESGIRGFQQVLRNAERGLSRAKENLDGVGLSYEMLRNLSPEEQFIAVAEALSRIEDPTRRAGLAMQLLGGAGQQLLPLLSEGADGIEALRDQARELGLTISSEAAAEAAKFTDRMNVLRRVLRRAVFTIGKALAPVVGELVERFTEVAVKASGWIRQNRELVVWAAKVGAAITAAGVALIGLGAAISLAGVALGGLASILTGVVKGFALLKAGITALLTPIGLVTTAVGALGAGLLHATGVGDKALTWLGDRFEDLRKVAMKAFQGIGDALAAGDIALAGRILWLSLRRVWIQGTNRLRRMWIDFRAEFNRIAAQAFFGAADIAVRAFGAIQRAWVRVREFFRQTFHEIRTGFRAAMEGRRVDAEVEALRARREAGEITDEQFRERFRDLMREGLERSREITDDHNQAMRRINEENERELRQINQRQAERLESIGQMLVDAKNQLEEGRDQALRETDQKLAEAQREWRKALEEARQAREAVGDASDAPDSFRGARRFLEDFEGIVGRLRDVAERTVQVRGTFSPAAIQGLAVTSDAEERTARATEQTARHTKRLDQKAEEGGLAFS